MMILMNVILGIVDYKIKMQERDYKRELEALEIFLESEIKQEIGTDCYRAGLMTCLMLIKNGL